MSLSQADIQRAVSDLKLAGRPLCVHSSLRSFGHVEGGAETVIAGLLAEGCTVMVPAFTYSNEALPSSARLRIERNGLSEQEIEQLRSLDPQPFRPESSDISADMGRIARSVIESPDRARGIHPVDSFAAIGSLSAELVETQTADRVYGPFERLIEHDGWVLLMGVGLNRMTLIHAAEQRSGREIFVRWALDECGDILPVRVGGCSEGFGSLAPAIAHLRRATTVGSSRWQAYPARAVLESAAEAIRQNPSITHCNRPECLLCNDAVAGGPVL